MHAASTVALGSDGSRMTVAAIELRPASISAQPGRQAEKVQWLHYLLECSVQALCREPESCACQGQGENLQLDLLANSASSASAAAWASHHEPRMLIWRLPSSLLSFSLPASVLAPLQLRQPEETIGCRRGHSGSKG